MVELHHIIEIIDSRADLQANLDARQIAIETDNAENLVYADDDGSYHITANLNEDATFLDVDCDDLTVSTGHGFSITDLTEGYVLFGGSSGAVDYDSNLFWDNSNKYLGIGLDAPLAPLHIQKSASSSAITPDSDTVLILEATSVSILQMYGSTANEIFLGSYSDNDDSKIVGLTGQRLEIHHGKVITLTNSGVTIGAIAEAGAGFLYLHPNNVSLGSSVFWVEQTDVDEGFIKFIGTAASSSLTNSLVSQGETPDFTVAGYAMIEVNDIGNQITDQKYYVAFGSLS